MTWHSLHHRRSASHNITSCIKLKVKQVVKKGVLQKCGYLKSSACYLEPGLLIRENILRIYY